MLGQIRKLAHKNQEYFRTLVLEKNNSIKEFRKV
jgi:hypothetical protein